MKNFLLLVAIGVLAVLAWGILRKSRPPKVDFVRVKRQTLVSTLPTNGKVEPYEWQAVRVESAGLVGKVPVHEGQTVSKGDVLATLSNPEIQASIQQAEAQVAEARANLTLLESGGNQSQQTEITNNLASARLRLQEEQKDYAALQRLAQKQAATRADVDAAERKVQATTLEIQGLERRRSALVNKNEVAAAQARLQDAQAALNLARQREGQSVLRAPLAGVVYGLTARPGMYLNTGDLVANVGRLDRLRVRVYVDEPELGRVSKGQPVTITWDGLPGHEWHGTVETKPASIQTLGTRQVGEVVCTIENPGGDLIPGTNVFADIRTAVVQNALVIPKEVLRHDSQGTYVLALRGDTVERQPVQTAVSSVTLVQVSGGLVEGDAVALPADTPLKPGDRVTPAIS
ncbi:MAG TPA: efflux RND transporter periplasmic adaptor subunit [Bryobacteraceae bacterium]|nr:efflux RND transporter periplasmic adaptor subunit [Bryobacteraceae bacterium]